MTSSAALATSVCASQADLRGTIRRQSSIILDRMIEKCWNQTKKIVELEQS